MRKKKESKRATGENFFAVRLVRINKILERFEKEVERALKRVVKRSEVTSKDLLKNFDDIASRISQTELYSRANESRQVLEKEFRKLREDMVARVRNFDQNITKPFFRELKSGVDQAVDLLAGSGLVETALDRATTARDQVLTLLNIPSRTEVTHLSRKIISLERKMKILAHRKPATAQGTAQEEAA